MEKSKNGVIMGKDYEGMPDETGACSDKTHKGAHTDGLTRQLGISG
jgi:hypothetical protein